jgi:hypothetical protein
MAQPHDVGPTAVDIAVDDPLRDQPVAFVRGRIEPLGSGDPADDERVDILQLPECGRRAKLRHPIVPAHRHVA